MKLTLTTAAVIATLAAANAPAFAADACLTPGFVKGTNHNGCFRDVAAYMETREGLEYAETQRANARIVEVNDVDVIQFDSPYQALDALFDGVRTVSGVALPN